MRVQVRLFAVVRERAGIDSFSLELPDGATAGDAVAQIGAKYPAVEKMLARAAVAVNQQYVERSALLRGDDELAIIPPVSGGAT